jgi:hypothetical protein
LTPRSIASAREVISLVLTVSASWLIGMDLMWVISKVIIDQAVVVLQNKALAGVEGSNGGVKRQMVSMIVISMMKVAADGVERQWSASQMLLVFLVAMASVKRSGQGNEGKRQVDKWVGIVGAIGASLIAR